MERLWKVTKQHHYGWVVVIGAFLALACDGIGERLYPYVLPSIKAELNLSHGLMGSISAAYFIAYAIMTPVWGIMADRIGPRRCMLVGQAIIIIGLSGMGFAQSFIASLLFYLLCGVGAAAQFVPAVTLISRWFGETRRGRVIGILMSVFGVITLALGLVVPVILVNLSWRWSWWIFAAVVPVMSIICWRLLVDNPSEKGLAPIGANNKELSVSDREDIKGSPGQIESKVTIKDIMKRGITWNLAGIFFAWGIGFIIFVTFGVAYLQEVGWSVKAAARVFAIFGALSIPGPIIWGIFADRLTKKYVFLIALAIQAIAVFVFLDSNPVARYVGAAIMGFTYFAIPVIMGATIADYYKPAVTGTTFGLITGITGIGLAIGLAVGGHLADITGTLNTAILFGLGALVLSFILTLALKKPPKRTVNTIA